MSTQTKMQQMVEQAESILANSKSKSTTSTVTTTDAAESKKFSDIQNNTFFKIIFGKTTPEEKKDAVAKALTFDSTQDKEISLARLKEYELFKAFLQTERQKMAQEIISLTDTGTFSQLKNVFDKLNSAILQFDEDLKPLTDVLSAVYDLRMAGKDTEGNDVTLGVFKEIKDEMKAEKERQLLLGQKQQTLQDLQDLLSRNESSIANLGQEKTLFGFGPVKKSAAQEIAQHQLENQQASTDITALAVEIEKLAQPSEESTKYAQFKEQKAQLMLLLNITDEGHIAQNKKLIESAQGFVNNTSKEVNGVQTHLSDMEAQTKRLGDGNSKLQGIYAILTDAVKDAATANKDCSVSFKTPAADEGALAKMKREDQLGTVNNFIKTMDFAMVDTLETYQGLAEENVRVQAMGDMCQQQIADVNKLATSGVAGVASSLATVVTGVAQTALNESSMMAKNSIAAMHDRTIQLTAQGSIQAAMGIGTLADDFNKAVAGMNEMYIGLTTATKIRTVGLENLKESKGKIEESIEALREAVKEATAVHADMDIQGGAAPARTVANDTAAVPAKGKPVDTLSNFHL